MGIQQPFEGEPGSEEAYIVNETTELEENQGKKSYASWEIEGSDKPTIRGEAIARGGENIKLLLVEAEEFEHYEEGENFWTEEVSDRSSTSVKIADRLEPLGFQNQRAKALVAIGHAFADTGIPANKDEIGEPSYVGRYTASTVLCFAFDQRCPVVDSNVVRIYNRTFSFDFSAPSSAYSARHSRTTRPRAKIS